MNQERRSSQVNPVVIQQRRFSNSEKAIHEKTPLSGKRGQRKPAKAGLN
jgi:hypothetical protein